MGSTPELGGIKGPAIYHFQQVSERFPLFWLATIPFFAYFENIRARTGWADPTKGGPLFGLKEDYQPGNLGSILSRHILLTAMERKLCRIRSLTMGALLCLVLLVLWHRSL